MNELEENDPVTWEALEGGDFVAKSEIPFSKLFTDQAIEQEIKQLKANSGYGGFEQGRSLFRQT